MLKIDIISGFLGAGKTTFIKRLLQTRIKDERVVLIENEFGQISVDSAFLGNSGIEIKELSQGCICCSLVGDFASSLGEVIDQYNPDRIIIEPSGVGKLSDVKKAVIKAGLGDYLNSFICLVDAQRAKMYLRNFGEFFKDQIESASTVVLSRVDVASDAQVNQSLDIIRELNSNANIVTTYINLLSDEDLINSYEGVEKKELDKLIEETLQSAKHHHHGEECDDPNCSCHHHHDHDEDECDDEECECHHHHHHDEDECDDPNCSCHHHHHDDDDEEVHEHHHRHHDHDDECDDPNCECHHHHHYEHDEHEHHHHHGHDADEVFATVGFETAKVFDLNQFKEVLNQLANTLDYGIIVRAKGVINTNEGWVEFNLSPNEVNITPSHSVITGMIVVIGSNIDKEEIKKLF